MPSSPEHEHVAATTSRDDRSWKGRAIRLSVVIAGLAATQAILFGPSLAGHKILRPLDILKLPRYYLPVTPETAHYIPENGIFGDEVLSIELRRRYAARELAAGQFPFWNPYNFCGAPFMAANNTTVFSPFRVLDYLTGADPRAIAWTQLLKALVGGLGAYAFFRRCLNVGFWPGTFGAWCFPLIGFLILWRGYPPSFVATWLPWVLLATDAAVRRPGGWGGIGLAFATAALLVSGHAGTAAHVLLVSGMYAIWALGNAYGWRRLASRPALRGAAATLAGWTLGVLVTSPQNLPTIEYLQLSQRAARRMAGRIEFPGMGPAALPQLVLPYFYGSSQRGSLYIAPGGSYASEVYRSPSSRLEDAPQGYAGLLLTLCLAPLALTSRESRSACVFWIIVAGLAASHMLAVPGVAQLFRVFPLKLLQNHRFIFVTAWCAIVLAVVGLDVLIRTAPKWRGWFWIPCGVLVALGAFCLYRVFALPEPLQRLAQAPVASEAKMAILQWFVVMYAGSFLLCLVGVAFWLALRWPLSQRRWFGATIATLAIGELIAVSYGVNPQCDPALYYPELPILTRLKTEAAPGRICGVDCLPACFNQVAWLPDIRGYDAASPQMLIDLFALCPLYVDGQRVENHNVSGTLWFTPPPESPILDMLNLRYRIHRGEPPPDVEPLFVAPDYWITESETVLPRAFVPRRVERVASSEQVLERLAQADFDAREVAYVIGEPGTMLEGAEGEATIVAEQSSEVTVDVDLETPGLVVLADLWYPGWHAYVDGRQVPILRTNHALRGVELPAGRSRVVFRYEPESFHQGLWLMAVGIGLMGGWASVVVLRSRRRRADV